MLLFCVESFAQKKEKKKKFKDRTEVASKKPEEKKAPKPYKKVIDSSVVTQKGLIDVHKMRENYLFLNC
jgi:hypothetical protein